MKFSAAQTLAAACGVTLEWLATGRDPAVAPAPPPPSRVKMFASIDMDVLGSAIDAARNFATSSGLNAEGRPFAQMVSILYDEGMVRIDEMKKNK